MMNQPFVPPVKIVTLFNYLPEPFTFFWAKTPYTLEAGEKMKMEDWKAKHAARHMADRWYEITPGMQGKNRHAEQAFIDKMNEAIIEVGQEVASTPGEISRLHTSLINDKQAPAPSPAQVAPSAPKVKKMTCTECGSTGPRHKKSCPKLVSAETHAAVA